MPLHEGARLQIIPQRLPCLHTEAINGDWRWSGRGAAVEEVPPGLGFGIGIVELVSKLELGRVVRGGRIWLFQRRSGGQRAACVKDSELDRVHALGG